MAQIILNSYAKLNLYLNVVNKRPDGFHNIETIFQEIDLYDKIEITSVPSGIKVSTNDINVPNGPENIAYKAADLILQKTALKTGINISISKNIPAAAGLGGGSSNAASVISGINKLFDLKLSFNDLLELAIPLGSDVPFFIKGGTAFAKGRGEILKWLLPLKDMHFVLVKHGIKPSTKEIYSNLNLKLTNKGNFDTKVKEYIKKGEIKGGEIKGILHNDLEASAVSFFPFLNEIKEDLLKAGAVETLMTGSGPTIFGIAESHKDAENIADKLKCKYDWVVTTKTRQPEKS